MVLVLSIYMVHGLQKADFKHILINHVHARHVHVLRLRTRRPWNGIGYVMNV